MSRPTIRDAAVPTGNSQPSGKFGRLFQLNALPLPRPNAGESPFSELAKTMTVGSDSPSGENPSIPAGYTFLGQFIDHDITFDPTSLKEAQIDPTTLRNFRTPALDLDSMYGGGPAVTPFIYQRPHPAQPGVPPDNQALFMIGATSQGIDDPSVPPSANDLPRALNGYACVPDPRNDENLIVAQLTLAFMRFHNAVVAWLLKRRPEDRPHPLRSTFDQARELVVWHYQWIVLKDFLPKIVGKELVQRILEGKPAFEVVNARGEVPFVPVEFSGAAYRFGHSMVRQSYVHNRVINEENEASLMQLFRFSGFSGASVPLPSDWVIDWRNYFDFGDIRPNASALIDPYLAPDLARLPGMPDGQSNLAGRNLERGQMLGLPSGQSIARHLSVGVLTPAEVASGPDGEIAAKYNMHIETPLWYYILKEAQVRQRGLHLGELGGQIVASTIIGLLMSDSTSYLRVEPDWKPCLPTQGDSFSMTDLLSFAGEINPLGDGRVPANAIDDSKAAE